MNASSKHHVIIGDGVVAMEFAVLAELSSGDKLTIIGVNVANFGRGIAYLDEAEDAPWRYSFLLNSPSEGVDLDFVGWMKDRWPQIEDTMRNRRPDWLASAKPFVDKDDIGALNAPRQLFGDYLQEQGEAVIAQHRKQGVKVKLVEDYVDDLSQASDGLRIKTRGGLLVHADTVDIATGGASNQRIKGDSGPHSFPQLVYNEEEIAKCLRTGVTVCCVGSNATMLDVLRLCQTMLPEDQFQFVAVSTTGHLPEPLIAPNPRRVTEPDFAGPYKTAEDFTAVVRREMDQAFASGDGMAEVRGGFRRKFIDEGLARFVPDIEQARKVPPAIKSWLLGGTRDSIQDLHRLISEDTAHVVAARVRKVENTEDGAIVHLSKADGTPATLSADVVINCAGPGRTLRFDSFTQSLIEKGWITVCPVSNGVVVGKDCQTKVKGVRYLSPATTVIGTDVIAYPLYDAGQLKHIMHKVLERTPQV